VTGGGRAEQTAFAPNPKFSKHSFGCHFVKVTWQPEVARLRVSRCVMVMDAGLILNPLADRNQIQGAVVMGIGMALFEGNTYDPQNGAPINSNMADYMMTVNADAPRVDSRFLDSPLTRRLMTWVHADRRDRSGRRCGRRDFGGPPRHRN
jgi:xanthine dehydrogenase YagR molybdenum-binding subunit